eukprot:4713428-Alexandrium_andersonii.AAC.1
MLHESHQSRVDASGVRPFDDPALRRPGVRLALAERLWRAGMLQSVSRCQGVINVFTVVKR